MITSIIQQIASNKEVYKALLSDLDKQLVSFKPTNTSWSILQVVCHLIDEEKEDFRQRVDYTLHRPGTAPPQIDPTGWVTSRKYDEQKFSVKVDELLLERQKSIDFLQSLNDPQWDQFYTHPTLGDLTAKHFLINWLAHDYIHIRQINRNKYLFLKDQSDNDCSYAGNWK